VETAKAKLDQLAEAGKKLRAADAAEAAAAADALVRSEEHVAQAHYDGRDMAFLQSVARRFAEKARERATLLTATRDGEHLFALAAGEGFPVDVPALGKEIAALLAGKGGGSGRVFQGKAADLSGRERALTRLREVTR
jgi:alanyl-tRNA synthetase